MTIIVTQQASPTTAHGSPIHRPVYQLSADAMKLQRDPSLLIAVHGFCCISSPWTIVQTLNLLVQLLLARWRWQDSISSVARAFGFSVQILPRRLPSNPSALCTVLRHSLQLFVNSLYLHWWDWNSQCLKLVGRLWRSSWEITIVVSHVRLLSPGIIFLVKSRSRAESVSIVSSLIIVRIGESVSGKFFSLYLFDNPVNLHCRPFLLLVVRISYDGFSDMNRGVVFLTT